MPTTRKKTIKIVYEADSDEETGDFSDSGSSEAHISEESESSEAHEEFKLVTSSGDEFEKDSKTQTAKRKPIKKAKFAKSFISKLNKQSSVDVEDDDKLPNVFTIKDLTDADKLLPPILNLSESDSSDDEEVNKSKNISPIKVTPKKFGSNVGDEESKIEYKDVWSQNIQDDSEEIAKRTFMALEQHKTTIEETKASLLNYRSSFQNEEKESNVKDLLALGEELLPTKNPTKKKIRAKKVQESDSEFEEWEEVKEDKVIPQKGLQLYVEFPDAVRKKAKAVDVEMMMKRKINRVKKEYQIYMHKVHVLCWLGHGNYVSRILNDQELMATALTLIPSKESYPGDRVDMKYIEQITTWYKGKLTLKQDKNEDKFRPKAPPLKSILIEQIKKRVATTKKYMVFIFVSMLRALGLQCRILFNFVTLPIKPPSTELCSLSIKNQSIDSENKANLTTVKKEKANNVKKKKGICSSKVNKKEVLPQVDGNYDSNMNYESYDSDIMQVDGNDDTLAKSRSLRSIRVKKLISPEEVSPHKILKKRPREETKNKNRIKIADADTKDDNIIKTLTDQNSNNKSKSLRTRRSHTLNPANISEEEILSTEISDKNTFDKPKNKQNKKLPQKKLQPKRNMRKKTSIAGESKLPELFEIKNSSILEETNFTTVTAECVEKIKEEVNFAGNKRKIIPEITTNVDKKNMKRPKLQFTDTNEDEKVESSKFFDGVSSSCNKLTRQRSQSSKVQDDKVSEQSSVRTKVRTKSAPATKEENEERSIYFCSKSETILKRPNSKNKKHDLTEEEKRVSHRDLVKTSSKLHNDVKGDLMKIIKNRIKDTKAGCRKGIFKGQSIDSDSESNHLPEEAPKRKYESDDDFKPQKISPRPSTSKKIDRRILSSDDETPPNRVDVWCEIFIEELEQWVCVDIFKAKVHAKDSIYQQATHPVCYIIGWDNNNYLKDLTRRYVPHWNTITRKQRVEPAWWDKALKPWLGPKTAKDREEDELLDRMQLEAPLPKSIAEYKNHPLYALKRHLLKFEAIYPPDAATLGFVRGEPVYARECVYVCRSRDTWLKEAKVVRLGESAYKVVKARPKWDKLSNKLITDKPLEVFGPWQVQDYEPPVAENGIVPRNAYGNVELFKECMLPKGTVHIKLPGLNKVAKKLNIDCAPAMTGFDFNGGWSHPVYDGFVVCKEFEEVVTEAWLKDQEEQERRERDKIEARVYGNWKRLIRGLLIRERLKEKYGFEEPSTSKVTKTKPKGPKLVVRKR